MKALAGRLLSVTRTTMLSLALVALVAALSVLSVRPATAATFQLSGKVSNQSGTGLSGALVEVVNPSTAATVASGTTDAGGQYTVSVEEGTYDVRVTPPAGSGFQEQRILNVQIANNSILNIALARLYPSLKNG